MEKIYCAICNDPIGEWDIDQNAAFSCGNGNVEKGHVYCVFRNSKTHTLERVIFKKYAVTYNRFRGRMTINMKWENYEEKPFEVNLDLGPDSRLPSSDEDVQNILLMG